MQIWRIRDWVYVQTAWGVMGCIQPDRGGCIFHGIWQSGNPHDESAPGGSMHKSFTVEEFLEQIAENERYYLANNRKFKGSS